MTHECTCKTCKRKFRSQQKDSTICYGCALKHFAGDGTPEEGDFNSARLTSGEMTDEQTRWLKRDLESVDHSRAEELERRIIEEYVEDEDRWTR